MTCERCWAEAIGRSRDQPMKSISEHYYDVMKEREDAGEVCAPREQAGQYWDEEKQIDTRSQHAKSCY